MKGSLMRIALGMAINLMAYAKNSNTIGNERNVYEMQAHTLSRGCCYANPEQGQFFAFKGRGHKLKGWKRVQLGLTKKRK